MGVSKVRFPGKTILLMKDLGLSESSVLDVFNHGEVIHGKDGMIKKYSGYEIGLFYARDNISGEYIITYVWKRDRR